MQLSARTLDRWYRQSRSAAGAGGLLKRHQRPVRKVPADDPFLAEVQRLYLHENGRKVQLCFNLAMQKAVEKGWKVWSYRKAALHIERIPPAVRIQAREGGKAYTDKCETFIDRDYSTIDSNTQWNADHHRLDVWVQTGSHVDTRTGDAQLKTDQMGMTESQKIIDNMKRASEASPDLFNPENIAASRKILDDYDKVLKNKDMDDQVKAFRESIETPTGKLQRTITDLKAMVSAGKITSAEFDAGADKARAEAFGPAKQGAFIRSGSAESQAARLDGLMQERGVGGNNSAQQLSIKKLSVASQTQRTLEEILQHLKNQEPTLTTNLPGVG
jgi:hypothetical protein